MTSAYQASKDPLPQASTGIRDDNRSGRVAQPPVEPWRPGDPYSHPVPKPQEPWKHCHTLIQDYDKGILEAWKEEVDKLLVFTDSTDSSAQIFEQILEELRRPSPDSLNPRAFSSRAPTPISWGVVRINVLWFLSLTLSLTTVLIGTLCMQWIREYHRDAHLPHKDTISLRQMRYEGLLNWKVPAIMSTLPLLLQCAVILFFAGLLDFLWSLNTIVAAVITVAVSSTILFLVLTTIAPCLQFLYLGEQDFHAVQCPYKSPQSWAFFRLGLGILRIAFLGSNSQSWISIFNVVKIKRALRDRNWIEHDLEQWRRIRGMDDLVRGIIWIDKTFSQSLEVVYSIYHCLMDLDISGAAQVVSEVNPGAAERLNIVLRNSTHQFRSEKRENINVTFWETHRRMHPDLKSYYLESVIRITNVQDSLPFIDWPVKDILVLPRDIIQQFLMSIASMVGRDLVTGPNAITIWALLRRVVEQNRKTGLGSHPDLVISIVDKFDQWVVRSKPGLEQKDRVSICVYGMVKVFRSSFDFHLAGREHPGLYVVVSLAISLDALLNQGVLSEALTPYVSQRWLELVNRCYHFQGLSKGGDERADTAIMA
ncbi:hypothetical protein DXG01_012640 [Tephrocybe rancida]|nr:hypothetical protein DXG01_012640 [Tephrocybe rancida]